MNFIQSLVIVDTIDNETNFWYVATGSRDGNQTRLTGAWSKSHPDSSFCKNLMSDRYFYATSEGKETLGKQSYVPINELNLKASITKASESINFLKNKLELEQSSRKSYKQLTNPQWVNLPNSSDLDSIIKLNQQNPNRTLEIAKWFAGLFGKWDNFQEQKMGSVFLKNISTAEYENFPLVTMN